MKTLQLAVELDVYSSCLHRVYTYQLISVTQQARSCLVKSVLPVMARRTSLAASSRASTEACSLYQDVCGVQIRLGASFSGPVEKLWRRIKVVTEKSSEAVHHAQLLVLLVCDGYLKGSASWTSRAAPRIRPSFRAWANAFSSTRPPLDVFTRKAPWRICITEFATGWLNYGEQTTPEKLSFCSKIQQHRPKSFGTNVFYFHSSDL